MLRRIDFQFWYSWFLPALPRTCVLVRIRLGMSRMMISIGRKPWIRRKWHSPKKKGNEVESRIVKIAHAIRKYWVKHAAVLKARGRGAAKSCFTMVVTSQPRERMRMILAARPFAKLHLGSKVKVSYNRRLCSTSLNKLKTGPGA